MKCSQQLFIKATQAYSDKDEERAYILYMRYFNVIQHVKKSAEYKKNQVLGINFCTIIMHAVFSRC